MQDITTNPDPHKSKRIAIVCVVIFIFLIVLTLAVIFHPRVPSISLYEPYMASLLPLGYNKGLNLKIRIPIQLKSKNFYAYDVEKLIVEAFPVDGSEAIKVNRLTRIIIRNFLLPPRSTVKELLTLDIPISVKKTAGYANICMDCYRHGNFSVRYVATLYLRNLPIAPVYSDVATIPCSIRGFLSGNFVQPRNDPTVIKVLDHNRAYDKPWDKVRLRLHTDTV